MRALNFDPKSGRLVSASYDRTVRLWELDLDLEGHAEDEAEREERGRMIREFKGNHDSHIFDVKFDVGRIVRWVLVSSFFDDALVLIGLDLALRMTRRSPSSTSRKAWRSANSFNPVLPSFSKSLFLGFPPLFISVTTHYGSQRMDS